MMARPCADVPILKDDWQMVRELNCHVEPPDIPASFFRPSITLMLNAVHRGRDVDGLIVTDVPFFVKVTGIAVPLISNRIKSLSVCFGSIAVSKVRTGVADVDTLMLPIFTPCTFGPPDVVNGSTNGAGSVLPSCAMTLSAVRLNDMLRANGSVNFTVIVLSLKVVVVSTFCRVSPLILSSKISPEDSISLSNTIVNSVGTVWTV